MTKFKNRTETELARQLILDAIEDIRKGGGNIGVFASALLLAAVEVYDEVYENDLPAALAAIIKAREVAAGRAGRA